MMNVYFEYGIYGLFSIVCLGLIASWIQKRRLIDILTIPNMIFGFVYGCIVKLLYDMIIEEVYGLYPIFTIIMLSLLGIAVFGSIIQIIFVDKFAKSERRVQK